MKTKHHLKDFKKISFKNNSHLLSDNPEYFAAFAEIQHYKEILSTNQLKTCKFRKRCFVHLHTTAVNVGEYLKKRKKCSVSQKPAIHGHNQ